MCGIAGGIGPSAPKRDLLESQLRLMEHRGPDDSGQYANSEICLGMCRLAIVEISDGKQPASDYSSRIQIVWNGEIYNYRELRANLESQGINFRGSSESEVIINLYLHNGIEFVEKLNGMFAIAIYDGRNHSLHLIRDRVGEKPLWISELRDGTLLFASEVRALMLARPDRTLRQAMVSEVLQYGFVNSPYSAFNEIRQVPPGVVLSWRNGMASTSKFWTPKFDSKIDVSYREAVEMTKDLIEKAVARRLISERPLGSFLSGGYDSTIVTAYMAKLMPKKVQTYSIGFHHEQYNEAHYAKRVAEYLGTEHYEEIINPDAAFVVEAISKVLDQPFADSSIIPTYLLAKFARRNLTVALGGDGGDEVFAGYDRYLATPILQKLNPMLGIFRKGFNLIYSHENDVPRKYKRIESQLFSKSTLASRYSSVVSLAQSYELQILLEPEVFSDLAEKRFIENFVQDEISPLDRMIRADFGGYLPGDLLYKSDIASMANSLELRSPLLDLDVVDWGLALPNKFRVSGIKTKRILKDVARSLVPAEIVDRPKMGFGIPRAEWLRTNMKEMVFDILQDRTARQRGWFKPHEVKKVITTHMSGKDQDNLLWPMLVLELWARNWLDPA